MNYLIRVALLAILPLLACGLAAQELQAEGSPASGEDAGRGVTAYPVAYFLELGAVSSLDIIRLVPGFTFKNADDSRGYSGAGGNVLINGRRPSTKTTELRQLLQRIPADSIERIEVIRGGTPGIDMQGQPIVTNLVRKAGAFDSGALDAVGKFHPTGDVGIITRVERSRRNDDLFLEGFLDVRREINDDKAGEGPVSRTDAAGNLIGQGRYVADNLAKRVNGLGTLEKETRNGLFRINAALSHDRNDDLEIITVQDTSGVESQDVFNGDTTESRIEVGADYEGGLGDGTSYQLVALQTLSWTDEDKTRVTANETQLATLEEQSGESILRGLIRRRLSPRLDVEAGAEGAFNFLESDSTLIEDDQVIDLPAANITVEELRGVLFSSLTIQPSDRTSVEFGLRAETSTISVAGDVDAENRFKFLKPRFVAAWASDGGVQLRLRTEREVGQLQFEDFAAGSELADSTVSAGNPDLEPERAWVYEAAYEQPIPGGSSLALTYRHFQIEEVIDVVPVQGFAAPGNIGDGTRDEIGISMSVPLGSIGPGLGRLQLSGTWRDSEVTDPVTGESREISGEGAFEGEILYTRDFPSLNSTFGMRGELTSKATDYRIDQVITTRNEHFWRVYWDWRVKPTLLFRAQVENATSRDRWLRRVRYDGLRSDGIVDSREHRSAVFDPALVLRIRWTFQ